MGEQLNAVGEQMKAGFNRRPRVATTANSARTPKKSHEER